MMFGWNMAMLIPASRLQGLALGIIASVDLILVLVLIAGILIQAFNLPLTYPACDDDLPGHGHLTTGGGSRTSIFDETSRQHCRAMVRNWAFCITVAVLYLLCALINLRLGFKGAREDARQGQMSAADVWIVESMDKAKRWVGIREPNPYDSSRTSGVRSAAPAEESVGLMSGQQEQEGAELGNLSRSHRGNEAKAD